MLEAKDPQALEFGRGRYVEELRAYSPELAVAQDLAGRFAKLMRGGEEEELTGWLREADQSDLQEIVAFARGILQDEAAVRAAVRAAIREPWSNGQVEGQVNRLKTLKRQMSGRANFDLLKRRVLGAA